MALPLMGVLEGAFRRPPPAVDSWSPSRSPRAPPVLLPEHTSRTDTQTHRCP